MKIPKVGNSRLVLNFSLLFFIITWIIMPGCHNPAPPTAKKAEPVGIIELLIGNGNHPFRNISLGEDPKLIIKSEKKSPDETDTNYIKYNLPLDTLHPDSVNEEIDSLNYYTVAYNFDQQKLNEVDEDIFVASDSIASKLVLRFNDYFTNKYGDGIQGSDCVVWSFKLNGKKMQISLSDQSEEYDYGKLSLVFYSEEY